MMGKLGQEEGGEWAGGRRGIRWKDIDKPQNPRAHTLPGIGRENEMRP